MLCVVCRKALDPAGARYANAWEASLKQHPCCSDACCGKFDVDVHWFPVALPAALADDAAARFMEVGKGRIRKGDAPALVTRDLLVAGVPPWMVRRALYGAVQAAATSDRQTKGWNLGAMLSTLFLGHGVFTHDSKRGLTSVRATLDGASEIDAWEEHFGLARSADEAGGP